jgi:hypothetical protein
MLLSHTGNLEPEWVHVGGWREPSRVERTQRSGRAVTLPRADTDSERLAELHTLSKAYLVRAFGPTALAARPASDARGLRPPSGCCGRRRLRIGWKRC